MLYKGLVVIITASVSESNTFCKRLRISATSLPLKPNKLKNSESIGGSLWCRGGH